MFGRRRRGRARPSYREAEIRWMQQKTVPKSGSLTGFDCAHSIRSDFIKAAGPELLVGPVMPHSVVSCRICTFYIKFHKADQFQPYSMPFDTFYSNLKYSHTILTRSVKNRLNCRYAGGQLRRIRRRPWILPVNGILARKEGFSASVCATCCSAPRFSTQQ